MQQGEVRTGEVEGRVGRQRHARGGLRLKAGTRGAHTEHELHVRDAGRVEAQRLVELMRVLPSRKGGMRCGARCWPGGGRACVRREAARGVGRRWRKRRAEGGPD